MPQANQQKPVLPAMNNPGGNYSGDDDDVPSLVYSDAYSGDARGGHEAGATAESDSESMPKLSENSEEENEGDVHGWTDSEGEGART